MLLLSPLATAQTLRAGMAGGGDGVRQQADLAMLQGYRALLAQIAAQSGIHFELAAYPPQRLDQLFQLARLDVEVGVNPGWRSLSPVAGFYTLPIGELEFVLCRAPVARGEARNGRLGVPAGLRYPQLDSLFLSRQWQRQDAADEAELLDQLRLGKVQAVVLERGRAEYWSGAAASVGCQPGESAGSVPVMLRLHPQYRGLLPRLNQAIQALGNQGKLRPLFHSGK
ncbi:hypothetical protein CEK28_09005 [Xenophilus sp. AP218F]|nr:hypothetical protein CEK28_09005 [Xenophilus sp. AP218F]